ncbi:predicted protein [Sparassis crispa]|uniref:Fungal-type protein kinase domain-containing protein n=1 Tax=Sparassis crispa TaxID=139825 RepID=A0A401GL93_9APHY|nr:predicted protein [Sparassis crispa]GBE82935.1 predicted protein [Sparassis crispa]
MATHRSQNPSHEGSSSSDATLQVPFVTISLENFLAEFMPEPDVATPRGEQDFKHMFDEMPSNGNGEEDLYNALIKCLREQNACPQYTAGWITESAMVDDHAAIFLTADKTSIKQNLHWAFQRLAIVCKPHYHRDDPFAKGTKSDKKNADRRMTTRYLLTTIATNVFSRQHRHFFFTVLILGDHARLLRWDRCGAVITEKFKYKGTPLFGSFLWQFSHLSRTQQGCDPNAEIVQSGSKEAGLVRRFISTQQSSMSNYTYTMFRKSMNDTNWLWWKLRIVPEVEELVEETQEHPRSGNRKRARGGTQPGPNTKRRRGPGGHATFDNDNNAPARYFLVGKPHYEQTKLPGRGTRGYIALDCEEEKPVFLKDAWRCDPLPLKKEGCVLKALNNAGVENVPTLVCHCDVDSQRTRTQDLWTLKNSGAASENDAPKTLIHYRLVLREICRPLKHYVTDKQFLYLVVDCIKAHEQAVERAGIMHTDISLGNMLIYEQRRIVKKRNSYRQWGGMLCDWEFSKPVHITPGGEKVSERAEGAMCTWATSGVRTLDNPGTPITVPDELEAFFHLILMVVVRDQSNNLGDDEHAFIAEYFDSRASNPDHNQYYVTCSKLKRDAMYEGKIAYKGTALQLYETEDHLQLHPFDDLISLLLSWFRAHYSVMLYDNWCNPPKRRLRSNAGQYVVEPPTRIANLKPEELNRRRELAAGLRTHRAMQDLILLFADRKWPPVQKPVFAPSHDQADSDIPHMVYTEKRDVEAGTEGNRYNNPLRRLESVEI